jgi:CubicO group peptidase (beta-lactamase class C family)
MSRRGRGILLAAALALVAPVAIAAQGSGSNGADQGGFSAERLKRITTWYQAEIDGGRLPGTVMAISRADKPVYLQTLGYQDREKKTAMKPDAIFRLASMTKPIISVAVMMLAEEGKIDILAPAHQFLPEFKELKVGVEKADPATGKSELAMEPMKRPITVQDLLRHTAGLVYGQFGDKAVHKLYREAKVLSRDDTLAEFITKLSTLPLAHQPGEVWEYSVATDVLGRIVEVVSGQPLDQFLEARIFKPLRMVDTGFHVPATKLGRLAEAQADAAGKRPALPDVTKMPKLLSGGGGLVSTVSDYLRFCQMLLNNGELGGTRILAPRTVQLMTANALPPGIRFVYGSGFGDLAPTPEMGQGWGLGFNIRTAPGHSALPGTVGTYYWTGAWGTTFWIDPKERFIAVQMIQVPIAETGKYRRAFRTLTYQALTKPAS